ncbi:MAG: cytochrome c3 family protein [Pirellulaceae bacterium]
MAWRGSSVLLTTALFLGMGSRGITSGAEESRFAATYSRSQYVHWIELYDAADQKIDPTDPNAAPYSPVFTCGRCHDYQAIAHGFHFNAMQKKQEPGRPGEPWLWTDTRTGTQIPLSYRGWPGTYDPRELGISMWDFVLKFGRHLPGAPVEAPVTEVSARESEAAAEPAPEGSPAQAAPEGSAADPPAVADNGRWNLSGQLGIDCMVCHGRGVSYDSEAWWNQIAKQNFAWAPAVALGIADVEGDVSKLPADFNPAPQTQSPPSAAVDEPQAAAAENTEAAAEGSAASEGAPEIASDQASATTDAGPGLPKTTYRALRLSSDKKIFFDIVRKPSNDACYFCHTTRVAGASAAPDWTHDEDVHLRAGMSCSDCHRNGLEHHIVRAFEGERDPTGVNVASLSCRGCHMDDESSAAPVVGGRLGAPKPLHRGLPPIHLERLSCTACHSGPQPSDDALRVQTAMAHGLGLPTHQLTAETEPGIVAPVMLRTDETLYPHRMVWPAFWGALKDDAIQPLNPDAVNEALRSTLRVKRNSTFTETLTKVTLKAEDKVAVLGEERAKVAITELTDEEQAKLAGLEKSQAVAAFQEKLGVALKSLKKIIKTDGAEPVYVAGGRVYRLGAEDKVETVAHKAADPYAWKLAHDVRPARWSSGASGCFECHAPGTPIFDGQVTAVGPAPDADPPVQKMAELAGYDRLQIDAWNQSFQGRTAFKWFGFLSAGVVGLILLSFLFLGLNGLVGFARRT